MCVTVTGDAVQKMTPQSAEQYYPTWTQSVLEFDENVEETDHEQGSRMCGGGTVGFPYLPTELEELSQRSCARESCEPEAACGPVPKRPAFDQPTSSSRAPPSNSPIFVHTQPRRRQRREVDGMQHAGCLYGGQYGAWVEAETEAVNPELLAAFEHLRQGRPPRVNTVSEGATSQTPGTQLESWSGDPPNCRTARLQGMKTGGQTRYLSGDTNGTSVQPLRNPPAIRISQVPCMRPQTQSPHTGHGFLLADDTKDVPSSCQSTVDSSLLSSPRDRCTDSRNSRGNHDSRSAASAPNYRTLTEDVSRERGSGTRAVEAVPTETAGPREPAFTYDFPGKPVALFYPEIYPDRVVVTDEAPDESAALGTVLSGNGQRADCPVAASMSRVPGSGVLDGQAKFSSMWVRSDGRLGGCVPVVSASMSPGMHPAGLTAQLWPLYPTQAGESRLLHSATLRPVKDVYSSPGF
ncbi:conserved hypothetical protein [Neospora caninum Liverpool]|uniref:Uncharacterized protein n=1 Tax=Neospora caninum (strain Liverpool) TaxID=572307 RepID=F0VIV7_NEOCL|nr:conserved hypothetical protein [Neospora caninum Liverpool]CBZ53668.1 conserved hypothetical protein [Neospora caninum Liverpool]CEL67658.1 TPA: hypothetical protein BN1204_034500 [Neospora caninum Liverpool]|eukprot:XP_003883700.1 conserved hypothetical protein [Neospora caninum Liverpool]